MRKIRLDILLVCLLSFILFYPVLNTYFSQDDFFHFKVSQTDGTLKGFVYLLGFHPFEERQIAFYRPISREILFNFFYNFFGLNSLPFRILQFILHFINIYLSFLLLKKVFSDYFLSQLGTIIFGISAVSTVPLYYLAGGIQSLMVTTFILLSQLVFLEFLQKDQIRYLLITFILFLFALASFELSFVIPPLIFILTLFNTKNIRKSLIYSLPFICVFIIYLLLNYYLIGFSKSEKEYHPIYSIKVVLNNYMWYFLWGLSLPQTLVDFVNPGFKLNPVLMKYWGNYYKLIFPSFFIITFIILFSLVKNLNKFFSSSKILLLLIWVLLSLLPVIFLRDHRSTHYLYPAMPAFSGLIAYLISQTTYYLETKSFLYAKLFFTIFLLTFSVLTITSINLLDETFWASQRGKAANKLISDIKTQYPNLSDRTILYIRDDKSYPFISEDWGGTAKQSALILNNSDAIRLLYKNNQIDVYYEKFNELPNDIDHSKVHEFTAKLF